MAGLAATLAPRRHEVAAGAPVAVRFGDLRRWGLRWRRARRYLERLQRAGQSRRREGISGIRRVDARRGCTW